MTKLSILMTCFTMIMARMDFIILPLHYTLKTSISNKPIFDFTPGRRAKLGSTDPTGTTTTLLHIMECSGGIVEYNTC